MKNADPEEISHSDTGSRGVFFLERDGRRVAELTYTMSAGAALVDHTYVEPHLRGGTIAPSLVEAVCAEGGVCGREEVGRPGEPEERPGTIRCGRRPA